MSGAVFLAWAHIWHHRWRSLILVLAIALIVVVPVTVSRVVDAAEAELGARAEATPLLIGARGSRLDLVMSALYFGEDQPDPLPYQASEDVWDSGLAVAIPLYQRFYAEGAPIIGTSLDYFDLRGLTVATGRGLTVLGDALLGANVAAGRGLNVGDHILSTPENLFDIAGSYPLRMPVVGILAATGTPDDDAIFVDVKTAWVMAGIGHGHEDVEGGANAAILQYAEITEENIDSFHFHGDTGSYPITAIIAEPWDQRASTILKGRYLDTSGPAQIVDPEEVMTALIDTVFAIKQVLDWVVRIVGIAALLAVALALHLTFRLRAREMQTAFRLGAGRFTTIQLLLAEAVILGGAAIALAAAVIFISQPYLSGDAVQLLTR
jgi:putative ABC transport system permease protein